jgi:hypothetical protein
MENGCARVVRVEDGALIEIVGILKEKKFSKRLAQQQCCSPLFWHKY